MMQVTAVVKYWLGGPDPLDYISMFGNPGTQVTGSRHVLGYHLNRNNSIAIGHVSMFTGISPNHKSLKFPQ